MVKDTDEKPDEETWVRPGKCQVPSAHGIGYVLSWCGCTHQLRSSPNPVLLGSCMGFLHVSIAQHYCHFQPLSHIWRMGQGRKFKLLIMAWCFLVTISVQVTRVGSVDKKFSRALITPSFQMIWEPCVKEESKTNIQTRSHVSDLISQEIKKGCSES